MIQDYVMVLYSAIKAYGPISVSSACDVVAMARNVKLTRAKSLVRSATSDFHQNNVLYINANDLIDIRKPIDVRGDEHLPWASYIEVYNGKKS